MSEDTIPVRSFHALLVEAGASDPALLAEARAVGVDLEVERTWYRLEQFRAVIELVRRHLYPGLTLEEGLYQTGRMYVHGFARTRVGRVLAGMAAMSGPERSLSRVPRYFEAGRKGVNIQMQALAPRDWLARVEDPLPLPEFVAGCLAAVVEIAGHTPDVSIVERSSNEFAVQIRWN